MDTLTAPNERCAAAGHKLGEVISRKITNALDAINERLTHLDGHPGTGGERNGGRTSDVSDPTSRAALRRASLLEHREDMRDAITDVCHTIDLLDTLIDDTLRNAGHVPDTPDLPLCRDGQQGKAGVIEWGDPMCCRLPTKAGLCGTHYQRWYRHRTDEGIDTSKDFQAA